MFLLLLSLLFSGTGAGHLIEHFECGPSRYPLFQLVAQKAISHCSDAVQDRANLCCKEHDLCFDVHSLTGKTRDTCDRRFCNCLQDVSDRTKDYDCSKQLSIFCYAASSDHGEEHFLAATPDTHEGKYVEFVDEKPLGLDMQSLMDACPYSRVVVAHCHNSVHKCLQGDHERIKRMEEEAIVDYSYKDCRSTMYHCLQVINDSAPSPNCTALVKRMSKELNIYTDLGERIKARCSDHRSLSDSRREDAIEKCFLSFHNCAANNREERPELYNAPRRIKIGCHRDLNSCIDDATRLERATSKACAEARTLAIERIRQTELKSERSFLELGAAIASSIADSIKHGAEKGWEAISETAADVAVDAFNTSKEIVGGAIDAVSDFWNTWGPGR